ncbi:Fanconi anemia group M protein isoform X4 [Hydra vulgaris]|uniref:Fanconi anemia group M protein isoform X4 n=1 Tax=Hydra vulgaris TaxID=6087 RepID=A0ABM4CG56_HYDVU
MKKFKLPATNQVNQSQSIKSTNQATILDTWGYFKKQSSEINEKKDCKKYNIETHQAQIQCEKITQGSNFFPHENENEGVDGEEIFNLFTDDNDLVKAVENTESVEQEVYLDTRFKQGSCCEVIPGFDEDIGSTYIYPINYPIRDYQFNIVRKALLENTLVVLPTGLGKTFLASVVMYNFYRWYPKGKLIFMAPTKPLVAQQIEACYKITGIPQVDTVEMTGIMAPVKRELLWKTKRVFFLTPQVFQNDLGRGSCFAPDVVCLVFDEAHRALGNHAYCQVVKEVMRYRSNFRVLALSATPGSDMKAVQQVISNLLISHVEVRTEESIDICKYVHHRNIEKIVVPMSMQLNKTKVLLLQVLQVAVKRLHSKKVIWHEEPEKLSRFQLIKAREQWRKNSAISDRVLQKFRNGGYNTIVSTSVGEEGLDIGDVDLIVCFDASNSPIRLVQRMGRTGRVRDGRIVILIGEGKEEATYKKCLSNKKGIHKNLLTAAKALNLYEENHRMIPRHLNPKCCKMNVHIEQFKEKNNNKKSVSKKTSASVSCKKGLNFKYLNTNEAKYLTEKFYGDAASCSKCKNLQSVYCHHLSYKKLSTSSWLPWLSTPQTVSNILHSKSTNALCSIMQFANECRDSDFLLNYNAKNLKLLNNSNDVVKDIANISVNNNLHKKVNFSTNAQMVEVFSIDDSDFEMSDIKPILLSNKKKKKSLSDSVNRNGNPSNTDVKVINNEDSFKPCPMEELLKSSEKVLSKKKKINLLKLPKVQVNKIDFDIKDNQVGFCSQETMPTLYDRCKQKRNGTSLLKNENIVTKSVSVNETNLCSKTLNTVNNKFQDFTNLSSSILSTIPLSPTWIDHLKSFETTNSSERMVVKDLIPDAPNDMNFDNFDSEKTSDRIVEKDLIPDAPNDMNFDSFDSEKTSGKMVVNDLVPDAPNDINFDSFDSGKTTNRMVVKDLIPDAPNHMNFDCFYSEKTSGRMVAKDLIPDAPNDMNFDSFDSEKMDFNDKVIVNNLVPCAPNDLNYDNTESKKLNDQENIPPTLMKKLNDQENIPPTLMKKLNDQENIPPTLMNYTNVKKKTEKRSLVITDSLIDYIDDFEEDICFSPPVVSNIKIKAKENISSDSLLNNNPVNKNNEKKSLQFSSINNEKIFNEDIDESIIFKKTHRKKKLLEISNCYDEQKNNGKQKIFAHSQNKEDDPLNLMSNKKVKQPVRKKSKLNNMKSKEKRYKNEYIAYEAEDDEGRIMDRESFIDDYIQDSFIDDATQFSPDNINKQNKDHIDMDTIYKRSLLSPSHAVANSLRFTTPAFKAGANRFRLADLKELKDSDQSSEAEEVLGLVESDEYHSNNELQDELAEQTSSFHLPILKRKKRCFSFLDSDDEFNSDADTEKSIYNDNTEVKPPVRVQPINESLIAKQILNKIDSQVCNSNIRFINECDLPTITFSFGIDWHGSNIDQEFNKDVQKIANKPQDKDLTLENVSPYILVSSRCIANSQIPSLLRSREKCCVVVKSQLHADFIVSRRMSVNKKSLSELSCSGNISQLYESVQCELFEKQYLIVEKDVAKINNKNKIPGYTKTCANLLSKFIGCNIKVLFSSSQEETSSLLCALAKLEVQNGYAICVPQTRDKMLKSLMCIPKMTYPLSTEVANQFRCIADLSKCSLESLKKILCNLPGELIKDIYFFFKKQFDIGMLGSKKLL